MLTRPSIQAIRAVTTGPQRRLIDVVHATAREHGRHAWLVGGAVRDLALGLAPGDLDVAIDGSAPRFARRIAGALAPGTVELRTEPRFGTASLILADAARLDLAQLRSEHYARPGALPVVRLGASLEADLARRDVSVNAIAFGIGGAVRGRLVDPFEGLRDLAQRRLCVLHAGSFRDDATRLWRNARTAAGAGLTPDEQSLRWTRDGARWLARISGERLWAEFELTARHRAAGRAVRTLADWGALRGTHEAWTVPEPSRQALQYRGTSPGAGVLAALLLAPLPRRSAILERLRAPTAVRATVEDARRLLAAAGGDADALAALEGVGLDARTAAASLGGTQQRLLQRQLRRWERTRSPLDATALIRLGVPPGPAIGQWLRRLRRARYDGTLEGAAAARRLVRRDLERARDR